jgi:large subunit ribosomal protein L27
MAHTKSAGAGKYGRDSRPKYLGVKKSDGEPVKPGDVIIRQRGTKFLPGVGVKRGADDTLFSIREGIVKFVSKRKVRFDGSKKNVKMVNVVLP